MSPISCVKSLVAAPALAVALFAVAAAPARAVPVDLELSLVIDVSGSVNATEYDLQMDGYANAFRNAAIQNAILTGGTHNAIAVNVVFFASSASEEIGFTLLNSAASINTFADTLDTFARPFSGLTDIFDGINLAVGTFGDETGGAANGFESLRQVIDVSGDGTSSSGPTQTARNNALAAGVDAINGIAIEASQGSTFITDFYANNVIGGANSFVITADGFGAFQQGITDKLQIEISGTVPEPGMIAIFGLGLLVIGLMRRRRTV